MDIRDHYNQWASSYDHDRNLTRDLDQEVTRAILADRRYRSIVELGCGTGKNTLLLARLAAKVQALDFSEAMLSAAQAKQPGPNVSFQVADLTQPWPCVDHSADLVVGNLVLEHIAELAFIFAEAARVLAPGGQFFLSELHPFKQYLGSQAVFQQGSERITIPAFVHHVSDFLTAANGAGLDLVQLQEWWHAEDQGSVPRLISLLFRQRAT